MYTEIKKVLLVFLIFIVFVFNVSCQTLYYNEPKTLFGPKPKAHPLNLFYASIYMFSTLNVTDPGVNANDATHMNQLYRTFGSHLKSTGIINNTQKSNYTIIFEIEGIGRISTVNMAFFFTTLGIIPMYDSKKVIIRARVFHRDGTSVKNYEYMVKHDVWWGITSFIIANILIRPFTDGLSINEKDIDYQKAGEIIFYNFIQEFSRDIAAGMYPENHPSDIRQDRLIYGMVSSGNFGNGFSTIQIQPDIFYKGEIKNGLPNGLGILIEQKTRRLGYWQNGKLSGKSKIEYPDGSYYKGLSIDGKPHGHGKLVTKEGIQSGEWKNGVYINP